MESIQNSLDPSDSGVVRITESNVDSAIAGSELVLMFFCPDWHNYSKRLFCIIRNTAKEIKKAGLGPDKVVIAQVDGSNQYDIRTRFGACQSIDIKLIRNGLVPKNSLKCNHTVQDFVELINEQLSDPIIIFNHLNELQDLSENKGHIIAYLDSRDQPEYDVLRKVATSLKDSNKFYVKFGDSLQDTLKGQLRVVFRSTGGIIVELDDEYQGSLLSVGDICTWVQQRTFPHLREITCELEEYLKENQLYFITLIHLPSDTQSVKKYKEAIRRELDTEKRLTYLIADGTRFQDLLLRLGKTKCDLPLIVAIADYRQIAEFDFNVMMEPGKLKDLAKEFYWQVYLQGKHLSRLTSFENNDYHISCLFE